MPASSLVSIIAPCYNGAKYLPVFLKSVLEQDYTPIELIFVDDGSTDKTKDCFNSYKEHFSSKGIKTEYVYQENKGAAAAINTGLARVHGEFLMWVDSDDILLPKNVSSKVEFLKAHEDCGFVVSEGEVVNEDNTAKVIYRLRRIPPQGRETLFEDLIFERNVIFGPGVIMARMEAMRKSLPPKGIYESREGQNWQLMLPLAYNYKCGYIHKSLFLCVAHQDSHSRRMRSYDEEIQRQRNFETLLVNTVDAIVQMPQEEKEKWETKILIKHQNNILKIAAAHRDWKTYSISKKTVIANNGKIEGKYRSIPMILFHQYNDPMILKTKNVLRKIKFYFAHKAKQRLCDSDFCTGCGACRAICTNDAIHFHEDAEGFLRPIIDMQKCINCGKCIKVCFALRGIENNIFHSDFKPVAYAMQAADRGLLRQSSSGGIFGLLAQFVLSQKGAVCGCVWNDDYKSVCHKLITRIDELPALYESKYIQSEIPSQVYRDIASFLQSGKMVLFCGTPCQVEGLNLFLRTTCKDENILENLRTISLICHGAPSPGVWRRHIEELEAQHQSKVSSARFRDKRDSWQNYSQVIRFDNGDEHISCVASPDIFMKFFLGGKNVILRQSCSDCIAKGQCRADIILGDFWGIEHVFPSLEAAEGVSAVLIHTSRGLALWKSITERLAFCLPTEAEAIAGNNSCLYGCIPMSTKRGRFYRLFMEGPLPLEEIRRRLENRTLSERLCSLYARGKNILKRMMGPARG